MPSGAELGVTATHWCGPGCCVTRGSSLSLSGPQRRSFQRLLFTISTEGRLLQREKSEAGGVAWGTERGLGGGGAGTRRQENTRGAARWPPARGVTGRQSRGPDHPAGSLPAACLTPQGGEGRGLLGLLRVISQAASFLGCGRPPLLVPRAPWALRSPGASARTCPQ